jgi:hypothetical protein
MIEEKSLFLNITRKFVKIVVVNKTTIIFLLKKVVNNPIIIKIPIASKLFLSK